MFNLIQKPVIFIIALFFLTLGSVGCKAPTFLASAASTKETAPASTGLVANMLATTAAQRNGGEIDLAQVINMPTGIVIDLNTGKVASQQNGPTPAAPAAPATVPAGNTPPSGQATATRPVDASPTPINPTPTPLPTGTAGPVPTMTPLPDTGTSLTIESAAIQAPNCSATPKTALRISKVNNFQALEVKLQFNPQIVQVVDADPNKAGVQIALGDILKSQQNFVVMNQVDQNTGIIDFAGTIVGQQGFSGAGVLLEITWTSKGNGVSQLTLSQAKVAGEGGGIIQTRLNNGQIEVSAECGG